MSCDLNKRSDDYQRDLKKISSLTIKTTKLNRLNNCIEKTIDARLNALVKKEEKINSRSNETKDGVTMNSMNNNTLSIYRYNFYYVIFKLLLFAILIGSYFLLSK